MSISTVSFFTYFSFNYSRIRAVLNGRFGNRKKNKTTRLTEMWQDELESKLST